MIKQCIYKDVYKVDLDDREKKLFLLKFKFYLVNYMVKILSLNEYNNYSNDNVFRYDISNILFFDFKSELAIRILGDTNDKKKHIYASLFKGEQLFFNNNKIFNIEYESDSDSIISINNTIQSEFNKFKIDLDSKDKVLFSFSVLPEIHNILKKIITPVSEVIDKNFIHNELLFNTMGSVLNELCLDLECELSSNKLYEKIRLMVYKYRLIINDKSISGMASTQNDIIINHIKLLYRNINNARILSGILINTYGNNYINHIKLYDDITYITESYTKKLNFNAHQKLHFYTTVLLIVELFNNSMLSTLKSIINYKLIKILKTELNINFEDYNDILIDYIISRFSENVLYLFGFQHINKELRPNLSAAIQILIYLRIGHIV